MNQKNVTLETKFRGKRKKRISSTQIPVRKNTSRSWRQPERLLSKRLLRN